MVRKTLRDKRSLPGFGAALARCAWQRGRKLYFAKPVSTLADPVLVCQNVRKPSINRSKITPDPSQGEPRIAALRRRTRAPRARWFCRSPRGSTPERICRPLRGTARVAFGLHRFGRGSRSYLRIAQPSSSTAAIAWLSGSKSILRIFEPLEARPDGSPERWLEANLTSGAKLGYDPWLHTPRQIERLAKSADAAGAELVAVEPNPIDAIWTDRPAPPLGKISLHPRKFAGEDTAKKAHPCHRRAGGQRCACWSAIRMRSPGSSTYAARMWRIRRCHWLTP